MNHDTGASPRTRRALTRNPAPVTLGCQLAMACSPHKARALSMLTTTSMAFPVPTSWAMASRSESDCTFGSTSVVTDGMAS